MSRADTPAASTFLVVTTVNEPTPAVLSLAAGSTAHGLRFVIVGDAKTPPGYHVESATFFGLDSQRSSEFELATVAPVGHYARKNLGYLHAMAEGAEIIIETDDDNHPRPCFFGEHPRIVAAPSVTVDGWVNVYDFFHKGQDSPIWPRGLPLDAVQSARSAVSVEAVETHDCPIQQGLADVDPDVDAIYRLLNPLPVSFEAGLSVALRPGAWSPFNSQNTRWFREAFLLMYLPAHCPFRMTDVWRSLIAQRIAWENGWRVLFRSPDVWHQRNEHNLMEDFADEIPGYLHNRELAERLSTVRIESGVEAIPEALRRCYRVAIDMGLIGGAEEGLLEAWLRDSGRLLGGG